jgi:hypothetical protein
MSELEKLREENNIFRKALELIADNDAADGRPFAIARSAINPEPQPPQVKEERVADSFVCERCHHAWYAFDNCCDYPKRPAGEVLKQEGDEK